MSGLAARFYEVEDLLALLLLILGGVAGGMALLFWYLVYGVQGLSYVFIPYLNFRLAHLWPGLALIALAAPYTMMSEGFEKGLALLMVGFGTALALEDIIQHVIVGSQQFDFIRVVQHVFLVMH